MFRESNDSWYDSPPEGFNLSLSPFATMFVTFFAWISSSSLAYIYDHDESLPEEYSCINKREYLGKVVSSDGCSSEIRQALAGCLARTLPGLIADLRLPVAISILEKELVTLEVKGEAQIQNLSEKLTAGGIDHKLWIEEPENIPTCLATKPYPNSVVSSSFTRLKLCK